MCFVPDSVYELFERQYGRAARWQLADRYLPGPRVDDLVRRRLFQPVARGVYRLRGGASPPESDAMTAVLLMRTRAGPAPMLVGPFVLGLFDIDGYSIRDGFRLHLPPGRRIRRAAFPVRHDSRLEVGRTTWGPLPIADVTRALLEEAESFVDLEAAGPPGRVARAERRLRVAVHSAMWRRATNEARLVDCAGKLGPRHRGATLVLHWAERGRLRAGSHPESDLVEFLRALGLDVLLQVQCTPLDRVDVLVPAVRLVIEFDGSIDHDESSRRQDRDRDDRLRAAGYTVLRIRAAELRDRAALERRIVEAVRACAARRGVVSPL